MFCARQKLWRHLRLALVVCAALACASCWKHKPPTRRPIDFVPSQAEVIAVVDYRRFVNDEVLRKVFDISQLERTLQTIGISSQNVLSIAGFARISLPPMAPLGHVRPERNPGQFGVIVQGKGGFDPVFKALSQAGWVFREHEGKGFWTDREESIAAAPIGSDMLAAGTPAAVRHVIDVAVGRAPGAMEAGSGCDCGAILHRIGITGEINIAISFSREMTVAARQLSQSAGIFGGMTGANIFGQLFDLLGSGRGVGLSFTSRKRAIASRVIFVAGDAASARIIAGLVAVAKILIPRIGDLGPMEQAAEMVRGLKVSSENNLVLIDFKIPHTILSGGMR